MPNATIAIGSAHLEPLQFSLVCRRVCCSRNNGKDNDNVFISPTRPSLGGEKAYFSHIKRKRGLFNDTLVYHGTCGNGDPGKEKL